MAGVVVVLILGFGRASRRTEAPAPARVDEAARLGFLEPGGRVEAGPPGWTHRVIRSLPRVASGEVGTLPRQALGTATLFRTVIAAEVVGKRGAYRLARVGVGHAVPVAGGERIVTPDGPPEVLSTLGLVERLVLREATAKLGEGRLRAATATFALYRAPTVLRVGRRHQDVALSYALLVDPESGTLTSLAWVGEAPGEAVVLPPDLAFDAALDVQVSRRIGPVPVAWSFALQAPPPGRRVAVPRALAQSLEAGGPVPEVERALRRLVRPDQAKVIGSPGGAPAPPASPARPARGVGGGSGPGRSG